MNFMCDVYVYEDVYGGWTTHVASNRMIFPPFPEIPFSWIPDLKGKFDDETRRMVYPNRGRAMLAHVVCTVWSWSHRVHLWFVGVIPRKNIGLSNDGESFNSETAEECAALLNELRTQGYNVPQYAIDALLEESLQKHNDNS